MQKKFNENIEKIAIGVLSGTSADGIDVVLVKIKGSGLNTHLTLIDFITQPYPQLIKKLILKNSHVKSARIDEICRLNIILGSLFGDAINKICKKNKIKSQEVSFIGSHGQTIHHLPDGEGLGGYRMKSTLQIGDPSVIANITGITTVGDFRVADCAVGGDGAPLVPYFDYIMFRSKTKNRALLNIGGISNITVIPKSCKKNEVIAFDTGPGNMIIDRIMMILYNRNFDKDGSIASKGTRNNKLYEFLKKDRYLKKIPPKSTGREYYGEIFVQNILKQSKGLSKEDIIRTVTDYTAFSIWYSYDRFIRNKTRIDELILSGGGSKNKIIYKELSSYFKGVKLLKVKLNKINVDNKESVLFAMLANECLSRNSSNMCSVTGSNREVILGKICLVR